MGADQINFAIRYREKDGIFDRPKREEIEEFIIDYSNTAGVGAEEGTNCVHRSQYSQITFDTCYGHIGAFCGLPKEMARKYPDHQFEFHYIEWYGDIWDQVDLYDGKQLVHRKWEVLPGNPEDYDEEDSENSNYDGKQPVRRSWEVFLGDLEDCDEEDSGDNNYDGKQPVHRSWEVLPGDPEDCGEEDSENNNAENLSQKQDADPFHAPQKWFADEYGFMDPHFIYIV